METHSSSPDSPCHVTPWRFPLFLTIVLVGMLLWNRNKLNPPPAEVPSEAVSWIPSPSHIGETVRLEIDFGNGARRLYDTLPWQADMTVEDVLNAAREFRPAITFEMIGEGAGGFLTELEGLKNEGAGGRNWRYDVAGTPGSQSFCLQKVAAGELVRWTFAAEEEGL